MPVLVVGAPLVHGTRVLNCAVVIHRGRVLGVAPKSYLPTYREFYERRWFAPGDDQHGSTITRRRCRGAVRARPDLPGGRRPRPRPARRGLRGHVGPGAAQRRGLARRCHGARQPLRQPDHGGPGRGPPAAGPQRQLPVQRGVRLRRGRAGGVDDRPLVGRADDGLRVRRPAGRDRAVPRRTAAVGHRRRPRPDPPGAVAAGHVRRQPSRSSGSPSSARSASSSVLPAATSACAARSTATRSCPTTRSGSRSTATRPTTSRSPGSSSGSTRSASPRSSSASAAGSTPRTP